MDVINTELIVMSLLGIGFDKVDNMLLALVTGKIILDCKNTGFKFEDTKPSSLFLENIKYDGTCFKIKENIFAFKNFSKEYSKEHLNVRLRNQNRKLTEYLKSINYTDIVLSKIYFLNITDYKERLELFSKKEIEIIKSYYKEDNFKMKIKNLNTFKKTDK